MTDRPYGHFSLEELQGIINDPRIGAAAKRRAAEERTRKLAEAASEGATIAAGTDGMVVRPATPKPKPRGTRPEDRMNKTERRYAAHLDADPLVTRWWFEHMKIRVGVERDWYTVDFMVLTVAGDIEMHEVKGPHVTEDAIEKFKAAALLYPQWVWIMVQQSDGGAWDALYEYAAARIEKGGTE